MARFAFQVHKLSLETQSKSSIGEEDDAEGLRARIRELEDLVARLREENATLRRGAAPARNGVQARFADSLAL